MTYALFVKGTINATGVDQPKKFTKICHSEDEVRLEFIRYCALEGYTGSRFKKAAMRLLENGYNDGNIDGFSFLATVVRFELEVTAY